MCSKYFRTVDTPIGKLELMSDGMALCGVRFGAGCAMQDEVPVLLAAQIELEEYFAGRRREFSVPLCMEGTPFQKAVWRELRKIPFGETASYRQIAMRLGNPGACRAVGMANHKNPLLVFVPCHRVIGADGRLAGYAGGLEAKKYLLEMEGIDVKV